VSERCRSGGTRNTFPLGRRWTIETHLRFSVAIIPSGIKALVDLCTIPAGRQFRVPILVPVLALALVTTNSVFACGIPVTIVEIVSRALVGIQTLASSTASIKASLAGADIVDTHGVDKRSRTVCIGCTGIIVLVLFLLLLLLLMTAFGLVVGSVQVVTPSPWRSSLHVQTKPSSAVGEDVHVALTWHADGDSRHLSVGMHLMGRHSTGTGSIISALWQGAQLGILDDNHICNALAGCS
jgi:hypothetical protein